MFGQITRLKFNVNNRSNDLYNFSYLLLTHRALPLLRSLRLSWSIII